MTQDKIREQAIEWDVDPNTGCWNCINRPLAKGYPYISRRSERTKVHRYIYQELFGVLPRDVLVRHTCDNRRCINPEHLIPGSQKDNARDAVERDRVKFGSQASKARLSEVQVLEILNDTTSSNKELAERYGVHSHSISDIRLRKSWKRLSDKHPPRVGRQVVYVSRAASKYLNEPTQP